MSVCCRPACLLTSCVVVCGHGVVDAVNLISPVVSGVADDAELQFRVDAAAFFLVML